LWRKTQKLIGQQVKMQQGYRKTGQESKKAGDAAQRAGRGGQQAFSQMKGVVMGVAGALGLGSGVAGALALVNKHYDAWLQNINAVAGATKTASKDMIAFATLQQGGTKAQRVMQAAALGARYSVPSGEAWNAVQALQSAPGRTFATGMKAAESVFAGSQVGIPVAKGLELEILGASQKQKPGDFIRMAYAAGQASSRDPMTLAGAASALKFFDDKTFGFAAGAVLSGSISKEKLPVYLRQAGLALSRSGSLQKFFEDKGMGGASQAERLRALNRLGIDTAVELQEAGVGELRQLEALAGLVPNVEAIDKTYKDIQRRAKPGLLAQQRAETEAELPTLKRTRMAEQIVQYGSNWIKLGPTADKAVQEQNKLNLEAMALSRIGLYKGLLGSKYYTATLAGELIPDLNPIERAGMELRSQRWMEHEASRIQADIGAGKGMPAYPYPMALPRGATRGGYITQQADRYHEMYPSIPQDRLEKIMEHYADRQDEMISVLKRMLDRAESQRLNPTLKRPDDDR